MMFRELFGHYPEKVENFIEEPDLYNHRKENMQMNKKELIFETLKKMGYSPEWDEDGDIALRYQLKKLYVLTNDDDEPYISVIMPQFHEIEEGTEPLVLATCNKLTRELKMMKVVVDEDFKQVSATNEFYYAGEEGLTLSMRHALELTGVVRSLFRHVMNDLSVSEE